MEKLANPKLTTKYEFFLCMLKIYPTDFIGKNTFSILLTKFYEDFRSKARQKFDNGVGSKIGQVLYETGGMMQETVSKTN